MSTPPTTTDEAEPPMSTTTVEHNGTEHQLSEEQADVLRRLQVDGANPTEVVKEIAAAREVSRNAIYSQIKKLREKGLLPEEKKAAGQQRGVKTSGSKTGKPKGSSSKTVSIATARRPTGTLDQQMARITAEIDQHRAALDELLVKRAQVEAARRALAG